jgi:hypothetical protein
MKYLILFILITLYSCDDTDYKSTNPEQNTTIELQQLAQQDSITYKIVQVEDIYYCINTNTNMVEYRIVNTSGTAKTLLMFLAAVFIIMLLLGIISDIV